MDLDFDVFNWLKKKFFFLIIQIIQKCPWYQTRAYGDMLLYHIKQLNIKIITAELALKQQEH